MSTDLFLTADDHFSHDNIRKHCFRPWSTLEDHDNALVSNWNDTVNRRGTVIIIGDLAWKRHAHWLGELNGKKILILGNHDKMGSDVLRQFSEVHERLFRSIDNRYCVFDHYAGLSWRSSFHGSIQFHGHSHGRIKDIPHILRIDMGVDAWGYRPVPWDIVIKRIAEKEEIRREWLAKNPNALGPHMEAEANVLENMALNAKFMPEITDFIRKRKALLPNDNGRPRTEHV